MKTPTYNEGDCAMWYGVMVTILEAMPRKNAKPDYVVRQHFDNSTGIAPECELEPIELDND